jgi:hypothetical protein
MLVLPLAARGGEARAGAPIRDASGGRARWCARRHGRSGGVPGHVVQQLVGKAADAVLAGGGAAAALILSHRSTEVESIGNLECVCLGFGD